MQLTDEQIEKLRQSGIRLDDQGVFWHEGEPVTHHGLRAAFFRWLDRNPDGRYVLRLDEKRFVYLDVDDAPLIVRSLRWEGATAIGVFSDQTEAPVDLATLRLEHGKPYLTARKQLAARLTNDAWTALADRLEESDGDVYLTLDGTRRRVPTTA